ncbi:GHKL domain-containing protein [Mediterraneibacter gnavus]|uniref:GHKL domain-containing protein n=1 Tax=Mediterraneibacter gnavus TaxID=33038 RepID=A0A415S9M0_MEDGN|nr:GHKL domain-containing protein [Mediterraneibacter gnavus]
MFFFIFGQLASLLEIIIVLHFLISFFKWKDDILYRKRIITGISIVLFMVAQLNGDFRCSHFVVVLLDGIILIVFCRLFLKGTLQIQILGCIIPLLIVTMCNIVVMQFIALYRSIDVQAYMRTQGVSFIAGVVISKVLLVSFLQWLLKNLGDTSHLCLSKKNYRILNAVCIYMVIMEFLLFYVTNMGIYHRKANILLEVISVGMVVTAIYIGYSVYIINKKNTELAKYEILEMQNQEKERRIQEIKRAEFRENQLIHDYKNHCMCIQNLLEKKHYEEAIQYLSEVMGQQVWNKREYIHTDNDTLDALINSKIGCCEAKEIPIHFMILGDMKNIRKMEMMVILFNLLDNAIEASELESKEKRGIEVELHCSNSVMEIFIKNNITYSVLLRNPQFWSNKEQRGHGIGHLSVEASVDELNGVIEYYEEQGQFCAHVFVPIYAD